MRPRRHKLRRVYLPAGAGKQAAQGHRGRHTLDKMVCSIAWRLWSGRLIRKCIQT